MRTRDTAAPLAALTGLDVGVDERLRETFAGDWQGRLSTEIEASDPETLAAWRSGADVRPGGGETRSEIADRAERAVEAALEDVPAAGVLVVVTHGGTARTLIGRYLGLPVERWHVVGGLANCSWSVLEQARASAGRPEFWRLVEHNAGTLPEPVMGDGE